MAYKSAIVLYYLLRSKIPFKKMWLSSVLQNQWAIRGFSCPGPRHPMSPSTSYPLDDIVIPVIAQAKRRKYINKKNIIVEITVRETNSKVQRHCWYQNL